MTNSGSDAVLQNALHGQRLSPDEIRHLLSRANQEKLIILTFDRDYGELIYKLRMPVPGGVVCFRFNPSNPAEPAEYVLQLLSEGILFENKFTVVERERLRQRPLLYIV